MEVLFIPVTGDYLFCLPSQERAQHYSRGPGLDHSRDGECTLGEGARIPDLRGWGICFQELVIGTAPGKKVCADRVDAEGCFSVCRGGWG